MNYFKLIYPNIRQISIRKYSIAYNINFVATCGTERLSKKSNRACIRNLSLQGFSEWQEQTYNSISNSYAVGFMQDSLLYIHDATGLPWWATIVSSTLFLRGFMTFPLSIYQNNILAKVENIGIELKDLVEELKKETAMAKHMYKLTDKQAMTLFKRSLKKQWNNLIVRDNCHPFKSSLVIWMQIPIWVCTSFALRNLVQMKPLQDAAALITFTEMSVGGVGWIPNLTVPDHSLVLPIVFGLTNLAIIEIQRMSKLRPPSKSYNIFTNVFRVFSVAMIPVAAYVPSCMCLYWTVSSSFGLVQNLVLLSPSVRRKLGIPEAPSEHEEPYKYMADEVREKINKTPIVASIYSSSRDEQYFSNPLTFLPYRWDRQDNRKIGLTHEPSASMPFALGARSCIGKKIALIQLTEFIKQVAEDFDFKCSNNTRINAVTSQVLVPDQAINLEFSIRQC